MNKNERSLFLQINRNLFRREDIPVLNEILEDVDVSVMSRVNFIKPTTLLLVSIFLGKFGADRFMLGDRKYGMVKLSLILLYYLLLSAIIAADDNSALSIFFSMTMVLSAIGTFLFWIYDVFTSLRRTKTRNLNTLTQAIGYTDAALPTEPDKSPERSYGTNGYNNNYNTSSEGSYQR